MKKLLLLIILLTSVSLLLCFEVEESNTKTTIDDIQLFVDVNDKIESITVDEFIEQRRVTITLGNTSDEFRRLDARGG